MTTWDGERWQVAAAELDALLDLEPAARETALAALFRRDAGLGSDVARLLADLRSVHAERFLESGAGAVLPTLTDSSAADPMPATRRAPGLPPGTTFGGYRILSILGRGGMGVVYQAEEVESGRRLALKVLEHRFEDESQRERFAREGRLAASIDHPHCVFVFGADEVDGVPIIAMELMQGTLADRVAASGALTPAAAVEATLQLIAGLEAAAHAGILHRDVKPSNCFVDADGTVKVGDFGISRSTRPTSDTTFATRGAISATPMYASPEQLRGEDLDVRSDIYSLGATLYELVTGRRPFDADDLMTLLMRVANDAPAAPHAIDRAIPRGLSDVVLRCLAKRPEHRFPDYAALATALAPFGATAPTPATLGRRLLAGLFDNVAIGLVQQTLMLTILMQTDRPPAPRPLWILIPIAPTLLYYGLSEAVWARSPGKALCALTVVDEHGRPLRAVHAWMRAALFVLAWIVIGQAHFWMSPDPMALLRLGPTLQRLHGYGIYVLFVAVMFVLARRGNGWAGLHDLATRTRVVATREREAAAPRAAETAPPAPARIVERYGAFVAHDAAIEGLDGWRPGFDQRLRRRVWVRELPPDAPPVSAHRAAVTRPTRLRWLAGRRGSGRAWDVYEHVAGRPIARACESPRGWRDVHRWLLDLSQELTTHDAGDRPPLRLDRVWVLDSGRIKLVDDPTVDSASGPTLSPAELLGNVARLGRTTAQSPWPVSAARFVDALQWHTADRDAELVPALRALSGRDTVSRTWRSLSIAGPLVLPLVLASGPLLTMSTTRHGAVMPGPDVPVLRLSDAVTAADRGHPLELASPEDAAIVRANQARLAQKMKEEMDAHLDRVRKAYVDDAVKRHPNDPGAAAAADRQFTHSLSRPMQRDGAPSPLYAAMLVFDGLAKVALLALASAILARSALLRLLGFEIVTAAGPASRLRVGVRAAIAWAAVLGPAAVFAASGDWFMNVATHIDVVYASMLVQTTGAAIAIAWPSRSLQDRLAGTWVVPR
jgi:uncharacterized RDD family membrane protein YckC